MALYQSITDAFATSLVLEKPAPGTSVKGTEAVQSQKVQVGHWLHDTPAKPARHQPAAAPRPPQESGNWLDNATAFFSTVVEDGSKNIVTNAEALWHAPEGKIQAARAVVEEGARFRQRAPSTLSRRRSPKRVPPCCSPPHAVAAPRTNNAKRPTCLASRAVVTTAPPPPPPPPPPPQQGVHLRSSGPTPRHRHQAASRVSFSGPSTSPAPSSGAAATRGAHERFLSASSTPSAGVRFQEQDALLHTAFLF
ncbi:hypothetical protein T484DRAFT_2284411 [Baffinella frigidus]|nr:hypothetical protein T484DRAFT_2284411 [Cryptophyta sp. CCMP2293]